MDLKGGKEMGNHLLPKPHHRCMSKRIIIKKIINGVKMTITAAAS